MAIDKLRPDFVTEFREAIENPAVMEELKEKFAVFSKASEKVAGGCPPTWLPKGSPSDSNQSTKKLI